jgi:hypothetical protein
MIAPPSHAPNPTTPMGPLVPHAVHGSPADLMELRTRAGGEFAREPSWWRPSAADIIRAVGWNWLWLVPTIGLSAFLVTIFIGGYWTWVLSNIKLLALPLVLGAWLAGKGMLRIVHGRKDHFCIHCGYSLDGLADEGDCPECGNPYLFRVIMEYKKDPGWFVSRYRQMSLLPPPAAAIVAGSGKTAHDGAS